jgi:hypothetical protein
MKVEVHPFWFEIRLIYLDGEFVSVGSIEPLE